MKKFALAMLILFSILAADGVTDTITAAEGSGGSTLYNNTGILHDWQASALGLALLTIVFIALARMLAEPLNSPELKAWANSELVQAAFTALLILFIVGFLTFTDAVVMDEVNLSPGSPVHCDTSEFCLFKVSNTYLDGLINMTQQSASDTFVKSVDAGRSSSYRNTFTCSSLYCLWIMTQWANNAFLILDVERYNMEIEQYGSILYSLSAQKFFINGVNYFAGPAILLIGIIARSFYMTRKTGGLMIAAAVGMMFVFPMMYLWDMITLNVTVYGDKLFDTDDEGCPSACGMMPNMTVAPCNDTIYAGCPMECRVLPYPYSSAGCINASVEYARMDVPLECKAQRIASSSDLTNSGCGLCPSQCKITPPLAGDHTCDPCFVSTTAGSEEAIPFSCRVALSHNISNDGGDTFVSDLSGRPERCLFSGSTTDANGNPITDPSTGEPFSTDANPYISATKSCPSSANDAYRNCDYIMPDPADCECTGPECCISTSDGVYNCITPYVNAANEVVYSCSTTGCLNYAGARAWDNDSVTCSCYGSNCTAPSVACNDCLNVTADFCLFNPPIIPDCADLCPDSASTKPTLLTPAEFAKKSGEGMFGREDIKNVSKLYLPGYLLPLINIVVTIMFIRGFSPLLGGDIELPGYLKVL